MRRTRLHLTVPAMVLLVLLSACGDDDDGDGATPTTTTAEVEAEDGAGSTVPSTDGSGALAALTSEEICSGLDAAELAAATGLEIDEPEPSTFHTPQCTYHYTSAEGSSQTIVIASMRAEDVGGRSPDDAFDYVLDVNRTLGGVADVAEVDAGDRAAQLTGDALNLGVVAVGDRVVTVIAPGGEGSDAATEATLRAVAEQLGG